MDWRAWIELYPKNHCTITHKWSLVRCRNRRKGGFYREVIPCTLSVTVTGDMLKMMEYTRAWHMVLPALSLLQMQTRTLLARTLLQGL